MVGFAVLVLSVPYTWTIDKMYIRRHKTIQEEYQDDYHRRTLIKQEERKGRTLNQIWTSNSRSGKDEKILELELNANYVDHMHVHVMWCISCSYVTNQPSVCRDGQIDVKRHIYCRQTTSIIVGTEIEDHASWYESRSTAAVVWNLTGLSTPEAIPN